MNKYLAIFIAIIVVAAGATYYYVMSKKYAQYLQQYGVAHAAHDLGNHDQAIQEFNVALQEAPTAATAAQTKLKIAVDLFMRNQTEDRAGAYNIYKTQALDQNVPPLYRALSLNDMAFTMDFSGDTVVLGQMVFNTQPFSDFMSTSNGDMNLATAKIYQLSNSIYPTAFAQTQVAFMTQVPLLDRLSSLTSVDKQTSQDAQQYLKTALPLFNSINYEKSKLAHLYLCYAMAWDISDLVLHNVNYADIENSYKQSISTAQEDSNVYSKSTEVISSLFYAISLNSRFGAARADDVKKLLQVFANADDVNHASAIPEYLRNVNARPNSNYAKKQIIALAKVSPELKSYLKSIGWSV